MSERLNHIKSICLKRRDELTKSMIYAMDLFKDLGLSLHRERYYFYEETRALNNEIIKMIDSKKPRHTINTKVDKYGKAIENYSSGNG